MPENESKQYYVQLPGAQYGQMWDADKYERNKDELFKKYPETVVAETSSFNPDDESPADFYTVHLPDSPQVQMWDADKFSRNRDKLFEKYPGTQVTRGRVVDYYGEKLVGTQSQINEIQSRYDANKEKYNGLDWANWAEANPDFAGLRGSAAESGKLYNAMAEDKKILDKLYAEREANPAYQSMVKRQQESLTAESSRIDGLMTSLLEQEKETNPDAAESYARRRTGGIATAANLAGLALRDEEFEKRANTLHAAYLMYDDALKTAKAPSRYDESKTGFGNFFRGLKGGAGEALSISNLIKAGLDMNLVDAIKKIHENAGEGTNIIELIQEPDKIDYLSDEEKELVKAFVVKSAIDAQRAGDLSLGYQSGQTAIQSLGFMADFLMFGGIGEAAANWATKGITKGIAKATINLGLKGVKREIAQAVPKLALGTVKSAVKTLVMTPMMPSSYANFVDNLLQLNDAGDVDLTGRALLGSAGDVFIETLSESAGPQVEAILGAPIKVVWKAGSEVFKGTKFIDWAKIVRNAPVTKLLKQAGWNGYIGEIGEEWYGNALRVMTGVDKDALKDFATVDQQIITLTSFAPMALFGGGVSAAQYGASKKKMANSAEVLSSLLKEHGYDEKTIQNILDVTKAENPKELADRLAPVVVQVAKDNGKSGEVFKAVCDYADAVARYRVFDGVHQADVSDQRKEMREQIQQGVGNDKWYQVKEYKTSSGGVVGVESVRTITDTDGHIRYVVSEDENGLGLIDNNGQTSIMGQGELAEKVENGEVVDSGRMPMSDYLDRELTAKKTFTEQTRMEIENGARVEEIRQKALPGVQVNIGTAESPVVATIIGWNGEKFVVESAERGAEEYDINQMAAALDIDMHVETDEEIENRQADEFITNEDFIKKVNAAKGMPITFNGQKFNFLTALNLHQDENGTWLVDVLPESDDMPEAIEMPISELRSAYEQYAPAIAEADKVEEEEKIAELSAEETAVDNIPRDFRGNPLPLKEDGSVNQTSLWNNDPEAWAKWNDANPNKRIDTKTYVQGRISSLEGDIKKLEKAIDKETKTTGDFDTIEGFANQIDEKRGRQAQLQKILDNYAAEEKAAAEKERARQLELGEPQSISQLATKVLQGVKAHSLNRDSFKKELGWGNKELSLFFPWWAKKGTGKSLDTLAEEMVELDGQYGFVPMVGDAEQKDTQVAKDALIEVMQSISRPGELRDMVLNENKAFEDAQKNAEEAAVEADIMARYGMTMDEYNALSDEEKAKLDSEQELIPQAEEIPATERQINYATPEEILQMRDKRRDWLSKENIEESLGLDREEIFEKFGAKPEPITAIPEQYVSLIGEGLTDNRVYSSKGYFIDHAVNHHPNVDIKDYDNIEDILNNPDDIKEKIFSNGKRSVIFIKKFEKNNAVAVQLETGEKGKIIWHKTFFSQEKEPYTNLKSIKPLDSAQEGGVSSIIRDNEMSHGSSLSARYADNKDSEISEIPTVADERNVNAIIDAARNGDDSAIAELQKWGIKPGVAGVYRFVSKGEVDYILGGGTYQGRFGNGFVDVTSNAGGSTGASAEYRITFKQQQDLYKDKENGNRAQIKNHNLGDGYITDGYSLEDVQTIEKRNADGSYSVVYSSSSNASASTEAETELVNQQIEEVRQEVNTNPSEAQKEAGNYKMGHISLDGLDISLENPKGSVRRGRDKSGKEWETTMHYDYGYIRSTMGVDGDHIDVFLSDNPSQGNVYVVDQVDPETGKFDEHKVMYGFNSIDEARQAYLSNYEEGWQGLGNITPVSKEEFRSWLQSSTKKTKPFAEYASVKPLVEKPQTLNEIPDEWMDSELQGRDAEVVGSIDEISDKDFKEYGRSVIVPNIPENVLSAIGAKDKNVLLKRGVFAKNDISHKFTPEQSRTILSAALYAPNLVGPSQKFTRPDYRVVIKTGGERNPIVVLDVSNTKDNLEIISWFSLDGRNLDRIKRQAIREGGELLILSPSSVPAASLSALPDAVLSESKGSEISEQSNTSQVNLNDRLNELLQETDGNLELVDVIDEQEAEKLVSMWDKFTELNDKYGEEWESKSKELNSKDKKVKQAAEKYLKPFEDAKDAASMEMVDYYNELLDKYELSADEEEEYDEDEPESKVTRKEKASLPAYEPSPNAATEEEIETTEVICLPDEMDSPQACRIHLYEKDGKWKYIAEVWTDNGSMSKGGTNDSYPYSSREEAIGFAHRYFRFYRDSIAKKKGWGTEGIDRFIAYVNEQNDIERRAEASRKKQNTETAVLDELRQTVGTYDNNVSNGDESFNWVASLIKDCLNFAEKNSSSKIGKKVLKAYADYNSRKISAESKAQFVKDIYGILGIKVTERTREESTKAPETSENIPSKTPEYGSQNTIVSKERYEELKKRMLSKLNNLNAGFDPETFAIGCEMAAYHIEAGARKFVDFSKKMIADLGDAIRPYLKSFYNGAKDLPGMEDFANETDSYATVSSTDVNGITLDEVSQQEPVAMREISIEGLINDLNRTGEARFSDNVEEEQQTDADNAEAEEEKTLSEEQVAELRSLYEQGGKEQEKLEKKRDADLQRQLEVLTDAELERDIEYSKEKKDATFEDWLNDSVQKRRIAEYLSGNSASWTVLQSDAKLYGSAKVNGAEDFRRANIEYARRNPSTTQLGIITKDKHTKTGEDLWVVKPSSRVSNEEFKNLKASARENNGYWSSFKHGFVFNTEEGANNFNNSNTIENGDETDIKTMADTAAVVGEAGTLAEQAQTIAESTDEQREEEVEETLDKIDSSLEQIDSQLAILGRFERSHTAVQKAMDLASSLSSDLRIYDHLDKIGARRADGTTEVREVWIRRPLGKGKPSLKIEISVERGEDGLYGSGIVRLSLIRGTQTLDTDILSAPDYNQFLGSIRGLAKNYLPAQPNSSDLLDAAKQMSESSRKKQENSVSLDGDELLGDLFSSMEDSKPADVEDVQPATRKITESNGYKIGDKVLYTRPGDTLQEVQTIVDFEDDGRPVLDPFGASWIHELADWENIERYVEPLNTESNVSRRSTGENREVGEGDGQADEQPVQGRVAGYDNNNPADNENGGRGLAELNAERSVEQSSSETKKPQTPAVKKNTRNNRVERGEDYAPKTPAARFSANVAAIKKMRELTEAGLQASKEDMSVLRQFTGWGGLGPFFNDKYSAQYRQLNELLSAEEMKGAKLSINTAYYTPVSIIDQMWEVAKNLGFTGGKVLEGSAGVGNILASMPKRMSEASDITAVEIDSVTGNILKLLYPDAVVHIQGFEDTRIPNNSVDLAITNVPFGENLTVSDEVERDLSRKMPKIHDFCIAKNVRKLKEGGIGIFITSRGTLDKSKNLRQWVVNEGGADFIGAFRLNNETFIGAPVTSDIIVIRKRVNGKVSPNAIDVSGTTVTRRETYTDKQGKYNRAKREFEYESTPVVMEYNSYLADHPEDMGGEMLFGFERGETFRPKSIGLYPNKSISQNKALSSWARRLRNDAEPAQATNTVEDNNEATSGVKEGQIILNSKGEICVSRQGKAVPLGVNSNKVKGYPKASVVRDYDAIKKALDEVLQYQLKNESDEGLKPLLGKLNAAYDTFVRKYGQLNRNTAISFLREDVDFSSIAAVENYRETESVDGKKKVEVTKTDIFKKRMIGHKAEPKPTSAKDGVIVSMNQFGRIDLGYIAKALGREEADVKKEILKTGLAFVDPVTNSLDVSYKYLSGNVREKLSYAKMYNENGDFDRNIEALEKVVPLDIPAHLIEFSLGSDWIDRKLYIDYAKDKFNVGDDFELACIGGVWQIVGNTWARFNNEKNRSAGVTSDLVGKTVYGHQLMVAAMNNSSVQFSKVEEVLGEKRTITDKEAAQAAVNKMSEMKEDFKEWSKAKMLEDVELATKVQEQYNSLFNAYAPMVISETFLPERFDGSVLSMDDKPFSLYKHQKTAVIRGTTEPLLLAHEVGSGKTYTLISTAMEMRRLGTAKKPLIVVQNATTGQFVASAKALYPNAKILTVTDSDHSAEGRATFYAKIKYNDWDLIIVPQSVFDMMPDSEERKRQYVQEKIEEKMYVIQQAKEAKADSNAIRSMENELKKLEEELDGKPTVRGQRNAKKEAEAEANAAARAKKQLARRVDDVSDFDDMGIDAVLVDEAHAYKKLGFTTSIKRGVKGVDGGYSQRSAGLYLKTRSVFDRSGWKNVVFATGTPISNTAAEIWTFMKYLMPADVMKQNHIYYFDDFVRNFGNIAQTLEFATNGKFKENTRFGAYVNVPELVRIWSSVSDTVLTREAEAASGTKLEDKLPKLEGGKAQDVFLPQSPTLIGIMNGVRAELEKFEKMSGKEKKENSHIPLTQYGIAKRAAIDPRLVKEGVMDEPVSKTNKAVEAILEDLKKTESYKGTAAIFCDNYRRLESREGEKNKVETFNLFKDMKAKLVAAGVPESQIVIIESGMSDKKRQQTFAAINSGDVRVVFGSTQTLGTGVNIQERLHLVIHMDAPDRPMDYTQRNGRILRQGNKHKDWDIPVRVLRFGVEDSLDVTSYQRLKTKSAFIDSIMNGKHYLSNSMEDRVLEEEEEGLFDNPVAVLSGSQFALLKTQAERELRKYQNKLQQHNQDQVYIEHQLTDNARSIERRTGWIEEYKKLLESAKSKFANGKAKVIELDGAKCHNEEELGKVLRERVYPEIKRFQSNVLDNFWRYNGMEAKEVKTYNLSFDGVKATIRMRMNAYFNTKGEKEVRTYYDFSCPELGIETSSGMQSFKGSISFFNDELASGKYFTEGIKRNEEEIRRMQSDNAEMNKRRGKPFADADKLEKAKALVDEYTEKMRAELEAKEAKYAAMNIEAIKVEDEEDFEDEDTSVVHNREIDEDSVERPLLDNNDTIVVAQAMTAVRRIQDRLGVPVRFVRGSDAKGHYTEGKNEVTINIGAHESIDDVVETYLHEAVAHFGLRQLMGDEFDSFIETVWDNCTEGMRSKIRSLMTKNGWTRAYATEEYIAELAQKTDYTKSERSLWRKIVDVVRSVINSISGRNNRITDETIREILVASYQNLENKNGKGKSAEMAKQLLSRMRDNAEVLVPRELTADVWKNEIEGKTFDTPIGKIKFGENQYDKNKGKGREREFGMLLPTVQRPDIIFEESASEEGAERQTKYVFVKTFVDEIGEKHINYASVSVLKNGMEIVESSHYLRDKQVLNKIKKEQMLWNRLEIDSSSSAQGSSNDQNNALSASKDTDNTENNNISGANILFRRAYHGSAADFERFDSSFAGTGEGAMAHGYGTYVAFDEKTGKAYAEQIARHNSGYVYDGLTPITTSGEQAIVNSIISRLSYMTIASSINEAKEDLKWGIQWAKKNREDRVADQEEALNFVNGLDASDFVYKESEKSLYEIEIPENDGTNYIDEMKTLSKSGRRRIADVVRSLPDNMLARDTHGSNWLPNGVQTLANAIENNQYAGLELRERLVDAFGSERFASDIFARAGFVGILYDGRRDGECAVIFNTDDLFILEHTHFRLREKPAPTKTGIGYKVFYSPDGGKTLYPPMVANPNGESTPVGVWLDADAAPVAGVSKTGRPQVKAGGKGTQGGSGQLAYRPGWHLGTIPYAIQFNRKDANGEKTLFPKDFVWAEVEYSADKNYQKEADAEGINANGKYQHSYAGLKRLPEDGFYMYRTNPNPETDPWIITGAMKVNKVLTKDEVDELVRKAGREPQLVEGESSETVGNNRNNSNFANTKASNNGQESENRSERMGERSDGISERGDSGRMVQESSEGESNRDDERYLAALGRELASYRRSIAENLGRKLVVYSEASRQLVESAKKFGIYYTFDEALALGKRRKDLDGTESVILETETDFIKIKDFKFALDKANTDYGSIIQTIQVFNKLFPDTKYTLIGVTEDGGDMKLILSQRKVSGNPVYNLAEINSVFDKAGFTIGRRYWSYSRGGIDVNDVNYSNILKDDAGNYHVIDCFIGVGRNFEDASINDIKPVIESRRIREEEGFSESETRERAGLDTIPPADPTNYKTSTAAKRLAAINTAFACGVKVEIVSRDQMPEGHKSARGLWQGGKIYVCPENNIDRDDVARTVLHEAVGHEGLRKLVGNANMTSFCLSLLERLPAEEKRKVVAAGVKNGGNFALATEDYLAGIAEEMDFSEEKNTVWGIISDFFHKLLAKLGINVKLRNRDLRWILWQSYYANKQTDMLVQARRYALQHKLGFSLNAQKQDAEMNQAIRAREADEKLSSAHLYNNEVSRVSSRLHEVYVDLNDSVNILVSSIEKASGKAAKSFEDIRLALNQQSSKGLAAIQEWENKYWTPLARTVKSMMEKFNLSIDEIERYVKIKHGLERNRVLAKRDAREYYESAFSSAISRIENTDWEDDIKAEAKRREKEKLDRHLAKIELGTDPKYNELRKQDYSGIISMYSDYDAIAEKGVDKTEEEYQARVLKSRHPMYDSLEEAEAAAEVEVSEFEMFTQGKTTDLWKRINAATKATLKHQYESNNLSKEQYNAVKDMFEYYVPLRGFKENTAEDMYSYYTGDRRNTFTPPLLRAKRRKTEADSPFGYIASMAESAIAADIKNETKLALYYFVSNRADNDLVTISDVWYENTGIDKDTGKRIFTPVYPPFNEDLTTESAKDAYRRWEANMKEKAAAGLAFKGKGKLNLHNSVIHISEEQKNSHIIKFRLGGKDMMMYINGNPRAAQALNNELNVEASAGYQRYFGKVLRWFSGINTSYNPEFWLSNAQRDALFALMSVDVKEDSEYGRAFRRNYLKLVSGLAPGRGGVHQLMLKYRNGDLGDSHIERLYKEFVEGGGVTGYTSLKGNEQWEREMRKATASLKGKYKISKSAAKTTLYGIKAGFEKVAEIGESIEQMTRFAAFMTAREQGKDIKQSVADAKELTVNFNRKGSGKAISWEETSKLRGKNGKKLNWAERVGVMSASWLPAYGRRFVMFFNASVQGINAMVQLYKNNPRKAGTWTAAYVAIGVLNAALHALLDDDDDYLDIPDYERRNNLLVGGGGVYFKWALPQEARVFYGFGDMVVNHALGRSPHKGIGEELLDMIGEIAPLDATSGLSAIVPSALAPVVEVMLNKDYKGSKIYNDLKYLSDEERKRTPAYQQAYQSTGRIYVDVSLALNSLTGGNYADAGWLNINPAIVEHLLKGATGGAGTTVGKLYRGTVGQALGEDFSVRNTPFLSRILTINDERYRNAHTTDLFYYYKAEAEHTKKLLKQYGKVGDTERINDLYEDGDVQIMHIYEGYKGIMKRYNDLLKVETDSDERRKLMAEQDEYRKQMIKDISEIK